jgi:hypothetical protein
MLIESEIDWAHIFIVVPIAGSRLYKQCEDKGYLLTKDYNQYTISKCNIKAPGVDPVAIEEYSQYMNLKVNFLENSNYKNNRFDKCLFYFKNVVNHYPTQAIAHYMLYQIYKQEKNYSLSNIEFNLFIEHKEIPFYKKMINKFEEEGYIFD